MCQITKFHDLYPLNYFIAEMFLLSKTGLPALTILFRTLGMCQKMSFMIYILYSITIYKTSSNIICPFYSWTLEGMMWYNMMWKEQFYQNCIIVGWAVGTPCIISSQNYFYFRKIPTVSRLFFSLN